jgi:hypothetical protein
MCPISWSPGMGPNYYFESLGGYTMFLNNNNIDFFESVPDNESFINAPNRANVLLLFSLITKSEANSTLVVLGNEQLSFNQLLNELKTSKLNLEKEFEVILICDHINTEEMRYIEEYVLDELRVQMKTFLVQNGKAYTFVI